MGTDISSTNPATNVTLNNAGAPQPSSAQPKPTAITASLQWYSSGRTVSLATTATAGWKQIEASAFQVVEQYARKLTDAYVYVPTVWSQVVAAHGFDSASRDGSSSRPMMQGAAYKLDQQRRTLREKRLPVFICFVLYSSKRGPGSVYRKDPVTNSWVPLPMSTFNAS